MCKTERPDLVDLTEVIPGLIPEIRYYSEYNFVGTPIAGYAEPCALLTGEAASALKDVGEEMLRHGFRLKVFDAYRPQSAVAHFLRWAQDPNDTRMKLFFYPALDKSQLVPMGYIAERSGHSRGSTVDLTLFDMAKNADADMGSPFDFFGDVSHFDYTCMLRAEQRRNRTLLRNSMLKHGFLPLDTEWWHFTLAREPYPDTYFDVPVSREAAGRSGF